MDKKAFAELVESLKWMQQHRKGKARGGRVTDTGKVGPARADRTRACVAEGGGERSGARAEGVERGLTRL